MRFVVTSVLVAAMLGLLMVATYLALSTRDGDMMVPPAGVGRAGNQPGSADQQTTDQQTNAASLPRAAQDETRALTSSPANKVLKVGAAELDVFLKEAEAPLLIDFWASWCAPCRTLDPVLETLAEEFAGRAIFLRVDVDEQPQLARRFAVAAVPTVIMLAEGVEVERWEGVVSASTLRQGLLRAGAREEVAVYSP